MKSYCLNIYYTSTQSQYRLAKKKPLAKTGDVILDNFPLNAFICLKTYARYELHLLLVLYRTHSFTVACDFSFRLNLSKHAAEDRENHGTGNQTLPRYEWKRLYSSYILILILFLPTFSSPLLIFVLNICSIFYFYFRTIYIVNR